MFKVLAIESQQTKFVVDSFEEYYELIKLLKPMDCTLALGKIAYFRVSPEKVIQMIAEDTRKFTWYSEEEL